MIRVSFRDMKAHFLPSFLVHESLGFVKLGRQNVPTAECSELNQTGRERVNPQCFRASVRWNEVVIVKLRNLKSFTP